MTLLLIYAVEIFEDLQKIILNPTMDNNIGFNTSNHHGKTVIIVSYVFFKESKYKNIVEYCKDFN
jgi:hypothetical protein